jgi:hypothetical protein
MLTAKASGSAGAPASALRSPVTDSALDRKRDTVAAWALVAFCACVVIVARTALRDSLAQKIDHDSWFGADTTRVLRDMFVLDANHYRSKVHPLFMGFMMPVAGLLKHVLRLPEYTAVTVINAALAGTWSWLLFRMFRSMGVCRWDAGLLVGVGMASSAALFWFSVPETYSLGTVSLLLPLWLLSRERLHPVRDAALVLAGAFSLGVTVTNFMSGVISALVSRPLRRAVVLCAMMAVLATAAWVVEKKTIPHTGGYFFRGQVEENSYLFDPRAGGPLRCLRAVLSHGMVMPAVVVGDDRSLGAQPSPMFGGVVQSAGVVSWFALLGLGLLSLLRSTAQPRLRRALLALTAAQVALHAVYGDETFLYTLHTSSLLLLIAAWAGAGPWKKLARVFVVALLILLPVNNISRLVEAARMPLPPPAPAAPTASAAGADGGRRIASPERDRAAPP